LLAAPQVTSIPKLLLTWRPELAISMPVAVSVTKTTRKTGGIIESREGGYPARKQFRAGSLMNGAAVQSRLMGDKSVSVDP
jgi:hypothetical protein